MKAKSSRADAKAIRRRRLAVHKLKAEDPSLSVRAIAERLGVPKSTVERDLKAERPTVNPPPAGAAKPNNRRAVKSGAFSERLIAPLREEAEGYARDRWPWLRDDDVALYARLAARVQLLGEYELEHGVVRDPVRGEVFATSTQLGQIEARLDKLVRRFDEDAPPGAVTEAGSAFRGPSDDDPVASELVGSLSGLSWQEVLADPDASARARALARHMASTEASPGPAAEDSHRPSRGQRSSSDRGELGPGRTVGELPPGVRPAIDDLLE